MKLLTESAVLEIREEMHQRLKELAKVASTGSYNDLIDKPSAPGSLKTFTEDDEKTSIKNHEVSFTSETEGSQVQLKNDDTLYLYGKDGIALETTDGAPITVNGKPLSQEGLILDMFAFGDFESDKGDQGQEQMFGHIEDNDDALKAFLGVDDIPTAQEYYDRLMSSSSSMKVTSNGEDVLQMSITGAVKADENELAINVHSHLYIMNKGVINGIFLVNFTDHTADCLIESWEYDEMEIGGPYYVDLHFSSYTQDGVNYNKYQLYHGNDTIKPNEVYSKKLKGYRIVYRFYDEDNHQYQAAFLNDAEGINRGSELYLYWTEVTSHNGGLKLPGITVFMFNSNGEIVYNSDEDKAIKGLVYNADFTRVVNGDDYVNLNFRKNAGWEIDASANIVDIDKVVYKNTVPSFAVISVNDGTQRDNMLCAGASTAFEGGVEYYYFADEVGSLCVKTEEVLNGNALVTNTDLQVYVYDRVNRVMNPVEGKTLQVKSFTYLAETKALADVKDVKDHLDLKQDKLTAGTGITINNNVISAEAASSVINISNVDFEVLSNDDPIIVHSVITDKDTIKEMLGYAEWPTAAQVFEDYTKSTPVIVRDRNDGDMPGHYVLNVTSVDKQDSKIYLTFEITIIAGDNGNEKTFSSQSGNIVIYFGNNAYFEITNNVYVGSITDRLDAKQDKLTAGSGIKIENNVISANAQEVTAQVFNHDALIEKIQELSPGTDWVASKDPVYSENWIYSREATYTNPQQSQAVAFYEGYMGFIKAYFGLTAYPTTRAEQTALLQSVKEAASFIVKNEYDLISINYVEVIPENTEITVRCQYPVNINGRDLVAESSVRIDLQAWALKLSEKAYTLDQTRITKVSEDLWSFKAYFGQNVATVIQQQLGAETSTIKTAIDSEIDKKVAVLTAAEITEDFEKIFEE